MRVDRTTVVAIGIGLLVLAGIVGFSLINRSDETPDAATPGVPDVSACRGWQLAVASDDPSGTLDDVDEAISYSRSYTAETGSDPMQAFLSYLDEPTVQELQDFTDQITALAGTPGLADDEYDAYLAVVQRTQELRARIDGAAGDMGTLAQLVLAARSAIGDASERCHGSA